MRNYEWDFFGLRKADVLGIRTEKENMFRSVNKMSLRLDLDNLEIRPKTFDIL